MKKNYFLFVSLIFVVFLNIFLSTWSVRHNDLNLHADVARDFLLLNELDEKKLFLLALDPEPAEYFMALFGLT